MGTSPHDSVVDPDSRVFGCANLFVTGSSVFPTASYVNPTLTIIALAARLGSYLANELSIIL
jgi:choline dehydrogenase-like flavoprotein